MKHSGLRAAYLGAGALLGAFLGAAGTAALYAQARPPAYVVGEIEILDQASYFREYVPPAVKAIEDGGGRYIVRIGKSVALYGEPPKGLAIMRFDSLEQAQAAFTSKAYTDAKIVGDKYARFRIYAVEGLAP